jgi:hypothetical protein
MLGTDPWLSATGGGADELEEFLELDWSLVDYPRTKETS